MDLAVDSVNQTRPLASVVMSAGPEFAVGIWNSLSCPDSGSNIPILFPSSSVNQMRPDESSVTLKGRVPFRGNCKE